MKPYYESNKGTVYHGDVLEVLKSMPGECSQMCVTSPPYWGLRDYGVDGQIGLEKTPEEYVEKMVEVFSEVKRVLRKDGTLWLNLGSSYAGSGMASGKCWENGNIPKHSKLQAGNIGSIKEKMKVPKGFKPKDLVPIPWMVAMALRSDGWWLRQDIIWNKPNPIPESVRDRCTRSHEYMLLLSKSAQYYYDAESIKEPSIQSDDRIRDRTNSKINRTPGQNPHGNLLRNDYPVRNKRSVWTITSKPFKGAHFATFPPKLIEPCILAGSRKGDVVLDPFLGSGTTIIVAYKNNRKGIGIELSKEYLDDIAIPRIKKCVKIHRFFK